MAGAVNIYGPATAKENLWSRHRVNLYVGETVPGMAGNTSIRTNNSFQTLYIERCERLCHVWAGSGRRFDLGEFYYGVRKTINLPSEVDELYIEWGDANDVSNTVTIPFGTTPGSNQFTLPIIDVWVSSTVVYMDESYDPRRVLAATEVFTQWDSSYDIADRGSSRALLRPSFAAIFRRPSRPYRLSISHAGNDRFPVATIWHGSDEATGSRILRLRKIDILPYEFTAVGDVVFDLMEIVTEPTGGVALTPQNMAGVHISEAVCRAAPSGGALESGEPISTHAIRSAIGFVNASDWITLYDDTFPDAMHPPELTRNVARGFAVVSDSDVAQSVRLFVRAWYTEQVGNLGIGG